MDEYRYKRFTTSLLFRDLRFRKGAAAPGDAFPKFELITTDGSHLDNGDVSVLQDTDGIELSRYGIAASQAQLVAQHGFEFGT